MKRRQWTICIAIVFVTWNALTYLFVARSPTQQPIEYLDETERHLSDLEAKLKEQVDQTGSLLKKFEAIKNGYKDEILKFKAKGGTDTEHVNIPGDSPLRNPSGPVANIPPPAHPSTKNLNDVVLPILVIACDRVTVTRNLDELIKYRPSEKRFPIIVSQDCGHAVTAQKIREYGSQVTLIQQPDLSAIPLANDMKKFIGYYKISRHYKWALTQIFDVMHHKAVIVVEDLSEIKLPWQQRKFQGYYKIARHYKWALNQIFHKLHYDVVIVVEDDLDIAPDFFEYFSATFPILHNDPSLWCVSAWHDNGKVNMIKDDPELLYRTDFFPGLGWMLEKPVWDEIKANWPATFWDDWMRHPDQRKDRSCIRPEISRTSTFGKQGVSKGQFFEKHLKYIKLNEKRVPFTERNLTYLMKENYDQAFVARVYGAPLMTMSQVLSNYDPEKTEVRVQYSDKQSYKTQSKKMGIMDDLKSGVPRVGYRGVVSFMYNNRRVHFAPPPDWSGYNTKWS